MFWKKKKTSGEGEILLAMIILADETSFDRERFATDYKSTYGVETAEWSENEVSAACTIDGHVIAVAHMPIPIPTGDMEGTAAYAYNWPTALEDTKTHKGHLIVTLFKGGHHPITRSRTFTQVLAALLRTTNSIGVYQGNQSLLIPKEQYVSEAADMSEDYFPLSLWIYFGLGSSEDGNFGYTYGLTAFHQSELEIVNSAQSLEDIRGFLFNIAHYVLEGDVTFEDGQTIGVSADEKIGITFSPGIRVKGDTFKLDY